MDESERDEGFKVSDKRRFTSEGEAKQETETPGEEPTRDEPEEPPRDEAEQAEEEAPREEPGEEESLPSVDFVGLVLSLGNTALFQLGLVQGPEGKVDKDLAGARQTIDIIALLEEKTKGNLTDQEEKILTETLFQLRMAFVEASK
jgi:hypothetical protein